MAKVIIDLLEQAKSLLEDIKENTTPSAGSGLKSISISPAITTTPALDSLFPIYWDDLTEEQKQSGEVILYAESIGYVPEGTYTVTITPTGDWYAINTDAGNVGGKGEPISAEVFQEEETELFQFTSVIVSDGNTPETTTKVITPIIQIRATGQ